MSEASESGSRPSEDGLREVARPVGAPPVGMVAPYDAGWNAHEIGLGRATVEVLSPDPGWALLGYDSRALVTRQRRSSRDLQDSPAASPVPEEQP